MYHRVLKKGAPKGRDWTYGVAEENFRKQLKTLEALNFTTITFRDYQLYLEDKLSLPKKPIILTFDDGHLDAYEVALPILRELDMRAVIYAIGNRDLQYATWDQESEDQKILPLMTNEQLLEARAEGFEIGAHSMTHPDLVKLSQRDQLNEIAGSKESLEDLLGEEIISFAYPYGRVCNSSHAIAKRAGFKFACGVYTGPPRFGDDIFNIRRLAVGYRTGLLAYLMKLVTPYEYLEWLNYKIKHKPSRVEGILEELDAPGIDYEETMKGKLERTSHTS